MALTETEKNDIVDKVVEILCAPDKDARLAELRNKVMSEVKGDLVSADDAAYSVLQAIEELYA